MTIGFQTGEEGKVDDSIVSDKDVQKIEFQEDEENAKQMLLGSHNIREYASTYCCACGIHNDEKDI